VATIVAEADINRSVSASFERAVGTVAGPSALVVVSGTGNVDESLVATVTATPGVRAAAGLVEAFVGLSNRPDETLYVLGMDFLGSPIWQAQLPRDAIDIPDELVFLSQLDSVIVGRAFAERIGLRDGDELRVVAPRGPQRLQVRGLLGDVAAARLFDGAIAVMDLPAAQRLLEREGRVDRIAITLEPGADVDEVRGRLAAALGPGVEVAAPEARGAQVNKLLVSLHAMLTAIGSFAFIVGALIVYQAVLVSVEQRRRQFALLDAVGIERSMLMRLCLVETAFLAGIGVVLGILGGWTLASLASGIVGGATSEIWFRVDVAHAARSGNGLVVAAVTGLSMALAAAWSGGTAHVRGADRGSPASGGGRGGDAPRRSLPSCSGSRCSPRPGRWCCSGRRPLDRRRGLIATVRRVLGGGTDGTLDRRWRRQGLALAGPRVAVAARSPRGGELPAQPPARRHHARDDRGGVRAGRVDERPGTELQRGLDRMDPRPLRGRRLRRQRFALPPACRSADGTGGARHAREHPGRGDVEPFRVLPIEFRSGRRSSGHLPRRPPAGSLRMVEGDLRAALTLRDGRKSCERQPGIPARPAPW
jgi:ABC-type lipoprotein release transport system permease subunit